MSLNALPYYRSLLLTTHSYKNEGATRFFGYVGPNGRTLGPKECTTFQDTFVHPQGLLTRAAILRDIANNDLKYGNFGIDFISNRVVQGTAWNTNDFLYPGRLVGVFVDQPENLNVTGPTPADARASLQVQNRIAAANTLGSSILNTATDVISAANGIVTGTEQTDLSGLLPSAAYFATQSGSVTLSAPANITGKTYAVSNATPGVVTVTDPLPFVNGDAVILTYTTGTITGVTSGTTVVFLGNITRSGANTTFTIHLTQAAALAGTGGAQSASSAVVTVIAPNAAFGDASGLTSPTATVTGTFSTDVVPGSTRITPVKINLASQGCGYLTAPTVTPGTTSGAVGTPIYAAAITSGRIRSIDVLHPCDILPGGRLSATLAGGGPLSAARVTFAVARFSV
jgi:hypothetical protein